jgi:Flp pilus assembly protein TadG
MTMLYVPARLSSSAQRDQGGAARCPRRAGSATVEFAVFVPILAALMLGMFEMGRAINVKDILSDAARKAGRTGILPNKATSDITAEVTNILNDNNISTSQVTMTVLVNGAAADASTAKRGDQISVKISIPATQVLWLAPFFLNNQSVDSETIVMMRQA